MASRSPRSSSTRRCPTTCTRRPSPRSTRSSATERRSPAPEMESGSLTADGRASHPLPRPLAARLPDRVLKWGLTGLAAAILILIAYFFIELISESSPVFQRYGFFNFVFSNEWVPSKQLYGALPLLVGTIITSVVALLIGVPVAVASALYITELSPKRLKDPLTILVELLAAVPSVVYGLWGVFVLIPKLKPAEQWFNDTFSFLPFVGGPVSGPNYFIAGLILAIMILPIVSAISREVIATVPVEHKEAELALGATRWEMLRMAVLPYSRAGISGAAMLGLGRAIGETIAATLVIGNAADIGHSLFSQGYTLAVVVANEFGEAASDPVHRASLIAAGLVLFVLTLVVNGVARYFVLRSERAAGRSRARRSCRSARGAGARTASRAGRSRSGRCSRSSRSSWSSSTCSRRGWGRSASTSSRRIPPAASSAIPAASAPRSSARC